MGDSQPRSNQINESSLNEFFKDTVYRIILAPCYFCPTSLACKRIRPVLNSPKCRCVNRNIICDIKFTLSYIRPLTRAKGAKNFPLYSSILKVYLSLKNRIIAWKQPLRNNQKSQMLLNILIPLIVIFQ